MSTWQTLKWGNACSGFPRVGQFILWLVGVALSGTALGLLVHTLIEAIR